MNDNELKQLVADTGRELLEKGLVARTWGNISARKDEKSFAISPSGLGYENMQGEDVPVYDMENDTWEGTRKPSSEKKIHAAAYRIYPDTGFVIHTHQDFATAVGLSDVSNLELTPEEKSLLGTISVAGYGLPGTKKLAKNVEIALANSKVVLMAHHGALILGTDKDDAMKKAEVLEEVCRREVIKKIGDEALLTDGTDIAPFKAQLDDMAQMIGPKYSKSAVEKAKEDLGDDDKAAMSLLIRKAIVARKYTNALNIDGRLSTFDCLLMRFVYKLKYSKQKDK